MEGHCNYFRPRVVYLSLLAVCHFLCQPPPDSDSRPFPPAPAFNHTRLIKRPSVLSLALQPCPPKYTHTHTHTQNCGLSLVVTRLRDDGGTRRNKKIMLSRGAGAPSHTHGGGVHVRGCPKFNVINWSLFEYSVKE